MDRDEYERGISKVAEIIRTKAYCPADSFEDNTENSLLLIVTGLGTDHDEKVNTINRQNYDKWKNDLRSDSQYVVRQWLLYSREIMSCSS